MSSAATLPAPSSLPPPARAVATPTAAPTSTPTTAITASILRIYAVFQRSPSLGPSPSVNAAFSELVSLCIRPYDSATAAAILEDRRVRAIANALRAKCSEGEFLLEAWWANRILAEEGRGEEAWTSLRAFPYYQNYMDLSRLELSALAAVHPAPIGSLAFIGSGPLPLTSICLSTLLSPPPRRIHNIDMSPQAISVSRSLCARLGGAAARLSFECADAKEVALEEFDVVVLAGLVGGSANEKREILRSVVRRCGNGALLMLRSAHGVRRLLYQEVELAELQALGLDVLLVVHPWNEVVNSVVVCRVRERGRL